jgi:ribonuclease T1
MLLRKQLTMKSVLRKWFYVLVLGLFLSPFYTTQVLAKDAPLPITSGVVSLSQLPPQAKEVYRLIFKGGPFEFEKDGTVFGNRERLLPSQRRGFYREYTVKTPYISHRGARRIVCGGQVTMQPEVCYYTNDHYSSFSKIQP